MTDHKPPAGGLWDLSSLVSGGGEQPPAGPPPAAAPPQPGPPPEPRAEPTRHAEPERASPPAVVSPPAWTMPRAEPTVVPEPVASAPGWRRPRIPSAVVGGAVALVVILGAVFGAIALSKPNEPAVGAYTGGQAGVEETTGGGWTDTEPAAP
ncbi:MAG TPA: hypothetical protein VK659_23730, partial [Asanoa sp.]|nr:hypothetical protein [Asanoa sp.]